MKKGIVIIAAVSFALSITACKAKYGCPSSGRNMGAEKLISGDKKSLKEAKKAGKFKQGKIPY
jgi:hypothetical protein